MTEGTVIVAKERVKPILNQHPWIFSRGIISASHAQNGDIVTVADPDGRFLARGYYNAKSQIQVRLLTWQDEAIDSAWWQKSLARAILARRALLAQHNAVRLVHAENDYLSGLVVDVYGQYAVLQALTLGIDARKQDIARWLAEVYNAHYPDRPLLGVYERSDVDVRGKEGLKASVGVLWGDAPKTAFAQLIAEEHGIRFQVDAVGGHKTGFYIDQRPNRHLLAESVLSLGVERPQVLNLFAYTGGFGVYALHAHPNASVVNVDASTSALALAQENNRLNGVAEGRAEFVAGNCFDYLRQAHQDGTQYDVIVCDPPKFAQNAQQVDKAARGYKDLNLQAFHLIREGGLLMTFSCSGAITRDLFQKIVFGALADSGRQAQILSHLSAGQDHPIALTFPEGEYLKGLLLRVY
jgi:23S rRNA (cytosine1962-C5)-methyltransferase